MAATKIPEDLNAELLRRANGGQSTRHLAEWLVETKRMESCSHMTVARRLHILRLESVAPPDASRAELAKRLHANETFFDDVIDSLTELEEAATYGDVSRGQAPDLAVAERLVRRRGQMVEAKQRYLTRRLEMLDEGERTELVKERLKAQALQASERAAELALAREEAAVKNRELLIEWKTRQARSEARAVRSEAPAPSAPPPAASPVRAEPKPGRNAPCPCGSGTKYKKCHGSEGAVTPAVTPTMGSAPGRK